MLICLNENFWFLNLNYCHILSVSRTIEWYMYELKRQKSFGPLFHSAILATHAREVK